MPCVHIILKKQQPLTDGNYDGKKLSFSFPFLHLYTNFASEL